MHQLITNCNHHPCQMTTATFASSRAACRALVERLSILHQRSSIQIPSQMHQTIRSHTSHNSVIADDTACVHGACAARPPWQASSAGQQARTPQRLQLWRPLAPQRGGNRRGPLGARACVRAALLRGDTPPPAACTPIVQSANMSNCKLVCKCWAHSHPYGNHTMTALLEWPHNSQ